MTSLASLAISPDGESVYTGSLGSTAVVHLERDTGAGALNLTPQGCVDDDDVAACGQSSEGLDSPAGLAVSPDGESVYAVGNGDNAIAHLERNTTTGVLTPDSCVQDNDNGGDACVTTSDGLGGATAVAVSPDDESVYVAAATGDDAVTQFHRNTATGALAPQGCVEETGHPETCTQDFEALDAPRGLALSEDGESLYAAASGLDAIVQFSREIASTPPPPPPPPDDPPAELPPPTISETVNLRPVEGSVAVKCVGNADFVPVERARQVAVGCLVDTREGRAELTSAANAQGKTQTAEFYAGLFRIKQGGGANPYTVLELAGSLGCGGGGGSSASRVNAVAAGGKGRKLWGKGKGKFKTKGNKGAGGVRGTTWLLADRCDGSTLGKVKEGKVAFRDFVKDKTVILKAGDRYVAKSR